MKSEDTQFASVDDTLLCQRDLMIFGVAYVDKEGHRISPSDIAPHTQEETVPKE